MNVRKLVVRIVCIVVICSCHRTRCTDCLDYHYCKGDNCGKGHCADC